MQASVRRKKTIPGNELRDPDGAALESPNLIFAGEHLTGVDLRVLARELQIEPRGARVASRVLDLIDDDTVAVVLACPLDGETLEEACSAVRAALARRELVIPIFATTRDGARVGELCPDELTEAFVWPEQRDALTRALAALLEPRARQIIETRERLAARISDAFDQTPPSVAVEVDDERRTVTIAGNVASRDEMQRVLDLITSEARGYRVDNFLAIAPEQRERDSRAAARIEFAITQVMPSASVDVSVIGERAVLNGRISDGQKRDTLRTLVKAQSEVERVISHVTASNPAAS